MSNSSTMRDRRPGQLLIDRLLVEQSVLAPQSKLAWLLGISPLGPKSWPWYLGALGEIEVGRVLDSLPTGWAIFHSLPIGTGDSDIDHLVLGPSGAYSINTKHHGGKKIWIAGYGMYVGGQPQKHYISNSESEADKVTKLLRRVIALFPDAQPVIALVNPGEITVKKRPARVKIMDSRKLRRFLIKQPAAIEFEHFQQLVHYLDSPELWRSESPSAENAGVRFAALDQAVRAANTRSLFWKAVGIVTLVVIAYNLMQAIISHL